MLEEPKAPRVSQEDALRRVRRSLDDAIAAPAGNEIAWRQALSNVTRRFVRVFERHIKDSESAGGPLDTVLSSKPQLGHRVEQIRAEHPRILQEMQQLLSAISRPDFGEAEVESLRLQAGRVQDLVRIHQARGADLLFEAYREEGGQG